MVLPSEILFQPNLAEMNSIGISGIMQRSIIKCEESLKKIMYSNIILIGGNTLLKGFAARINKELTHLAPASINVNIISSSQRQFSTWIGGSMLTSQTQFKDVYVIYILLYIYMMYLIYINSWVTKEMYEEKGANILNVRCF